MLDSVPKHHADVAAIQPTWHCLLRFRQRVKLEPGTDAALSALRDSLARADVSRVPPAWVAGRERGAEMWAVDDDLAYPLSRSGAGEWIAATVLKRGVR